MTSGHDRHLPARASRARSESRDTTALTGRPWRGQRMARPDGQTLVRCAFLL